MPWSRLRRKSGRATLAALTLIAASCAARGPIATPPTSSPIDARRQLQQDLQGLFDNPATAHGQWAATFHSLVHGETLFSLNSRKFMIPASSQKLVTSAVAAERLGWDFRYTTRISSTAPIGDEGAIAGDLIVVGSGDPTINPRHPERWRALDDWAAALKARGVRVIHGRLIGDDNAIAEPAWGFGWSWDDLSFGYGAEPSALQFHENQVEVTVGPGMANGAPAIITTAPAGSGLVVNAAVKTMAAGAETSIGIGRVPGTPFLAVRGQIGEGAQPVSILAAAENPTRFFLSAFRDALGRHGISVLGGIADIDELSGAPPETSLHELIVDRSPPLLDVIDVTLKWSRNIYAESMLLSLAPSGGPATAAAGLQRVRDTLSSWGVGGSDYLARDGSGLSRYDYVTADTMASLLTQMWMDPRHHDAFLSTLPVSGLSGTLATRMKGTPAEGRVRAKTGTMSNVRSLCGYVTTADGEAIVFALLANDFRVPAAEIDAIMDRALARIVTFRR